MTQWTDYYFAEDEDGVLDLVVENADLKTTAGLETSVIVSLFSDRRADVSEIPDPMRRRGWIGDLAADVPGDRHGSGLWLYEQSRLTAETAIGVRNEAVQSLDWMIEDDLVQYSEADVSTDGGNRLLWLTVTLHHLDGLVTSRAFRLADATRAGLLTRGENAL